MYVLSGRFKRGMFLARFQTKSVDWQDRFASLGFATRHIAKCPSFDPDLGNRLMVGFAKTVPGFCPETRPVCLALAALTGCGVSVFTMPLTKQGHRTKYLQD